MSEAAAMVPDVPEKIPASPWISEYDYPNRKVTLTLADARPHGFQWSGIRKDAALSDPGGDFDVFVAYNATDDRAFDHENAPIVKVVARLDDVGGLVDVHPDFDIGAIGSMTIWPYKVAGERFGLAHWMWWNGPPFRKQPRSWADAKRDGSIGTNAGTDDAEEATVKVPRARRKAARANNR